MEGDIRNEFKADAAAVLEDVSRHVRAIGDAGGYDPEQLNAVFRVAHAVKNGAASLELSSIRELAHAVGLVVELIRERQLTLAPECVQTVQNAFADLGDMVEQAADESSLASPRHMPLLRLAQDCVPEQQREAIITMRSLHHPQSGVVFTVSEFELMRVQKDGSYLYWVEYDLDKDVRQQGHTPFERMRFLENSGRILDCRISENTSLQGGAPTFSLLYASILEQELVKSILQLPQEKILCYSGYEEDLAIPDAPLVARDCPLAGGREEPRRVEISLEEESEPLAASEANAMATQQATATQLIPNGADPVSETAKTLAPGVFLEGPPTGCVLRISGPAGVERAEELRTAMLAALEHCHDLEVDCAGVENVDITFLQLLWGMWLSARARGVRIHCSGLSESLLHAIELCGLQRAVAESYGLDAFPCARTQ